MNKQPALSINQLISLLTPRHGRVRVVLDTDTFNEVDDQFAIAQLMLASERVALEAIYAAPFHNERSEGPGHGMELSYGEASKVLDLLAVEPRPKLFRGAANWVGRDKQPLPCEAADDLIARARSASPDDPLYVVAIGAITNIAIALLRDPTLVERVVVIWIAGHALDWPDAADFNLRQDIGAAQVLFDSGAAIVLVPAMGVSSHMICTVPEIERFVEPFGNIGKFLASRFKAYRAGDRWSKEIWDLAAAAWLLDENWVQSELVPRPIITDQGTWSFDRARPLMRYISFVQRDKIMTDLYEKLETSTREL